jgi:mRNA-degrading endonuclease toxin of MazEF toxin-antitoxin module
MKVRPVLLLTLAVGPVPEVLVSYISSVVPNQLLHTDLVLDPSDPNFRSTNLKTLSVLRLHKLATIHTSSLVRHLGFINGKASNVVAKKLAALLAL